MLGSRGPSYGGSNAATGAVGQEASMGVRHNVQAELHAFFLVLCTALHPVKAQEGTEIDLSRYEPTFVEEFDTLDVSPLGPGTRWIAHTPWSGGDFGAAAFADPGDGFPFTIQNGVLRIEARKGADGKWRSGLLASVDRTGKGFSQQFGYFEMRAKLPAGEGVWPAFWLVGRDRSTHTAEIDVFEHQGRFPYRFTSSVHVWDRMEPKKSRSAHHRIAVPSGSLSEQFHTYGAEVDSQRVRIYFDRREVWSTATPNEHHQSMYVLLNLALGSSWPIENTPSPSFMFVDYVRVWQQKR
jgi:Glycosyl hydrolases family 16